MAPSRKRKSDEMADPATPEATGTPAPKKMRITQTQKQALIDNLQLEITERARHLRAHYALQCADLKARIERRINRIPMSMRSITMQELMDKHQTKSKSPPKRSPVKPIAVAKTYPTIPPRGTRKRKSSIVIAADPPQEHESTASEAATTKQPVTAPKSNPKGAKRTASRTGRAAGVLSPRSHNSRTLPRSPLKGHPTDSATDYNHKPAQPSPAKSLSTRPLSPLKSHSPLKSAAIATTSAITSSVHNILSTARSTATRSNKPTTRPATATARTVSQASNHSATSNATTTSTGTVVKSATTKPKTVRGRAAAATKKAATAALNAGIEKASVAKDKPATKTRAGTVKKTAGTAATKKAAAAVVGASATEAVPATGKRILRKRN